MGGGDGERGREELSSWLGIVIPSRLVFLRERGQVLTETVNQTYRSMKMFGPVGGIEGMKLLLL